jgi:hypothetical protein
VLEGAFIGTASGAGRFEESAYHCSDLFLHFFCFFTALYIGNTTQSLGI